MLLSQNLCSFLKKIMFIRTSGMTYPFSRLSAAVKPGMFLIIGIMGPVLGENVFKGIPAEFG
jgi:hypothetical protein